MHFCSKLLLDARKCLRRIFACLKRDSYSYTPVQLMRSEIEIETLLESDDMPVAHFISAPPPKRKCLHDVLEILDSQDNIVSFDLNDNMKTMTESDLFYSCEDAVSSDEDVFGIDENFRLDEEDIDFFHNTRVE
tara:strand:+ start:414 stop:815 length:402 start_codon:yes stop_codon:yes gene_type:complete